MISVMQMKKGWYRVIQFVAATLVKLTELANNEKRLRQIIWFFTKLKNICIWKIVWSTLKKSKYI